MKMESRITGIFTEKDKDSRITYCNHVFVEYAGVASEDQILGRTDEDFPWQEFAEIYRRHELDALAGNNYSIIFPAKVAHTNEYRIFLHSKAAKLDEQGTIVGLQCHALEVINPEIQQLFSHLMQKLPKECATLSIGKPSTLALTPREKDILFFIAKAKTAKRMAQILNVSPRTVYSHIEHIKTKLNCRTKGELADVAYQMGFAQELPNLFTVKAWVNQ